MDKKQIIEDYLQGRHPIEQNSWEVPSTQELDNAEAEFDRIKKSLTPRPLRKERGLKFWPLAIAACLAGFVVIFLAPPRTTEEQLPLALEEPVVTEQPVTKEEPAETKTEVEAPKRTKRVAKRKLVVPHEPVEEPLLAEAEAPAEEVRPILPEMKDPFLAIAQQMQDIRSRGEQVRQIVAQLIDNQVNLQ